MLGTKLLGLFMIVQVLQLQINGTVLRIKREPSPLNALNKGIDALLSQNASAKDEPAKDASAKATNGESFQDEKYDAEVLRKAANNETSELEVSLKAASETNSEINTKPSKAGNDLTLDAQVSPKITNDTVLNEEISPKTTTNKAKVEAIADDGFFHQPIDSDENLSIELEEALRLEEEEKELKEKGVIEKQGGEEVYVDEELLKASKIEAANKEMKQNEVIAKSSSEANDADVYVDESLLKAASSTDAVAGDKQDGVGGKPDSEKNTGINVDKTLMKEHRTVKAEADDGFFHQPIDSDENLSIEREEAMRFKEEEKEMKPEEVGEKHDDEEVYVDEALLKGEGEEAIKLKEDEKEIKQEEVGEKHGGEEVYVNEALLKAASNGESTPDDGFFHQPIDSDENLSIELEEIIRLEEEEKENKRKGVGEKRGGEEVYADEGLLKGASKIEATKDYGFFHQPISSVEKLAKKIKEATRLEDEKDIKQNGVVAKSGGETNANVFTDESLLKAARNKQDEKPGIEINVSKQLMKARSNIKAIEHDSFFHEPFDSDENLTFELEEAIRLKEEAEEMKRNGVGEESDSENDDSSEVYDDKLLLKGINKLKANLIDSDENLSIDFEKERSNSLEGKEISQNSLGRNPPNSQRRFLDENNHEVVSKNIIIIPETNADVINLSIFNKPPKQAFMDQLKADMAMQNLDSFPQVTHHKYQATKSFKSGDSINFHIPDFVTLKKLLQNSEIYLKTEKGMNYGVPCTIKEGNLFVCKPKSTSVGKASRRHGNFKEHSQNPKKKNRKHHGYNRQDSMIRNKSDSHKYANRRKAFPVVLQNNGYQHEPWMKLKYY